MNSLQKFSPHERVLRLTKKGTQVYLPILFKFECYYRLKSKQRVLFYTIFSFFFISRKLHPTKMCKIYKKNILLFTTSFPPFLYFSHKFLSTNTSRQKLRVFLFFPKCHLWQQFFYSKFLVK